MIRHGAVAAARVRGRAGAEADRRPAQGLRRRRDHDELEGPRRRHGVRLARRRDRDHGRAARRSGSSTAASSRAADDAEPTRASSPRRTPTEHLERRRAAAARIRRRGDRAGARRGPGSRWALRRWSAIDDAATRWRGSRSHALAEPHRSRRQLCALRRARRQLHRRHRLRPRRGLARAARGRAARAQPALELRNLAVDGATSDEVLEQLPEAIELEPDLVTVVCGANDVLRSTRPDAERYARRLALIFGRLRGACPGVAHRDGDLARALGLPRARPADARAGWRRGIAALNAMTRGRRRRARRPLPRGRRPSGPRRAGELRRRRPASLAARPRARGRGFAALLRDRLGIEIADTRLGGDETSRVAIDARGSATSSTTPRADDHRGRPGLVRRR